MGHLFRKEERKEGSRTVATRGCGEYWKILTPRGRFSRSGERGGRGAVLLRGKERENSDLELVAKRLKKGFGRR